MRTAGKAGGSAPDAMMCRARDRRLAAVEVAHLAGPHMCGADCQSRLATLDEREVNESVSVFSSGAVE